MDSEKISQLVDKSVLASPPDLLFKIINSLDSELSSRQIGEIIGHDQSISAQVLKLSNSSFFGFKGNIRTLDRAINILGTKTVRNIAVTTLLFAHTNKIRLWNIDILNFWLHTYLVADITRELSQKVGLDGDEAYIAGLLHDIGRLVLYAQKQEKADIFRRVHTSEDIFQYEEATWGIRSNELSKLLLTKWNIPEDTIKAIAEHSNPENSSMLAKVVHIANEFSSVVTDMYFKSQITYPVFRGLLNEIGMKEEDFTRFTVQIPDITERGQMIMKVMSKQQNTMTLKHRLISRATLITPEPHPLSECLLKLLGFSVEVFSPQEVDNYRHFLNEEEEKRKREFDMLNETSGPTTECQDELNRARAVEFKKPGFFKRLFSKTRLTPEENGGSHIEEVLQVKPINWNPLVIFDKCDPVELERMSAVIYQVLRDPSQIKGHPLPFFFASPDIKTQ
ncbi:MAG: hypothetical protein A2020_13775 [Lentisphaerae bacterium GWF2_45_14]|nr:MAG: hypothetical protein A2020_13775 [Lentisphaerae bacterium GWF2_45_14]